MRAGRVVHIRVRPQDCMAVVDVMQKIGIIVPGMSFAQCVSIALGSLLESARQRGILPKRDGFEYNEMMSPFVEDSVQARAKKLAVSDVIDKATAGGELALPTLPETLDPSPAEVQYSRKLRRWSELKAKQEADPENFGEQEKTEFSRLYGELFK